MFVGLALVLAIPLGESVLYTVNERELAVLLQFGEPVASRTKPGLYFKLPLTQEVLRLPKTLQVWHGTSQEEKLVDVPTADGKKVEVTVWAVWRISDPAQFVQTLRTVNNAESRVKEFVRSTARDTITTHKLAEIVRSTNRKMTYTLGLPPEVVAQAGAARQERCRSPTRTKPFSTSSFPRRPRNRSRRAGLKITAQIKNNAQRLWPRPARARSKGRGIELVDVGLSRIEFVPQVREAAFDRAISLMEAIAVKAISEGEQRKNGNHQQGQGRSAENRGPGQAGSQHPQRPRRRRDHRLLRQGDPGDRRVLQLHPHPRSLQGGTQRRNPADPDHRQRAAPDDQDPRAVQGDRAQSQPGRGHRAQPGSSSGRA